jgi:hypothetical protein
MRRVMRSATAVRCLHRTIAALDCALRERFRDVIAGWLSIAAAERGLALVCISKDCVRRSIGRVAAQRALQLCHILTIKGRGYHPWLPRHSA